LELYLSARTPSTASLRQSQLNLNFHFGRPLNLALGLLFGTLPSIFQLAIIKAVVAAGLAPPPLPSENENFKLLPRKKRPLFA
jgi:hypothetical protein